MKKALSIILLVCLIFSLGALIGCNNGEETSAPPVTTPSTAPTETVKDPTEDPDDGGNDIQKKLDAGEYVLVGFSLSSVNDEMTLTQATEIQQKYSNIGIDLQYVASGDDIALQITQIENLITMGAAQIIIASNEPNALKEICERAMDEGVQIVFSGEADVDRMGYVVTGANAMDGYTTGVNMAKMALAWVDRQFPDAAEGEIHVGIMSIAGVSMSDDCTRGYNDVFEGTPCQITYEAPLCITADHGYSAAQEGITFDSQIRIFLGFTVDAAIGASNYILANSADYNLSDYATFCCGSSTAAMEMIDTSPDNEAILRGLIVIGDPNDTTADLWIVCHDLLFGLEEAPYYRMNSLSSYNAIGYEM